MNHLIRFSMGLVAILTTVATVVAAVLGFNGLILVIAHIVDGNSLTGTLNIVSLVSLGLTSLSVPYIVGLSIEKEDKPNTENKPAVYIDSLIQQEGLDYTLNGEEIVFKNHLPAGSAVWVRQEPHVNKNRFYKTD